MPTGYTVGIVNGEIKDFEQYAKLCMRAFGVAIHMKDDSLDKPYEPIVSSDYYKEELKSAKQSLKIAQDASPEEITKISLKKLTESKKYHKKSIVEAKIRQGRLEAILKDAEKYQPPTKDHEGIKKFMIDQIKQTIDWDCDLKYHKDELAKIKLDIANFNPETARQQMINSAEKDITYYKKEHRLELKRCREANKWAELYLESLKKQKDA